GRGGGRGPAAPVQRRPPRTCRRAAAGGARAAEGVPGRARRRRRGGRHRRGGTGGGPARSQRRREDHHPADGARPGPAQRRGGAAVRAPGVAGRAGAVPGRGAGRGTRAPAAPVRPGEPHRLLACHGPSGEGRPDDGGGADRRPRRRHRPQGAHLQPRHAAAPGGGTGDAGPAGPAAARRADRRSRPAADRPDAADAGALRRGWARGPALLAPAGRSGADLHPRGGDGQGPGGGRRTGRGGGRRVRHREPRGLRPGRRDPRPGRPRRRPRRRGRRWRSGGRRRRAAAGGPGGRAGAGRRGGRAGGRPAPAGGRVPHPGRGGHDRERGPVSGRVRPRPRRDGRAPGYRPARTLTVAAEWRRQAGRRRTRLILPVPVALPLVMLAAFQLGGDGDEEPGPSGGRFSSMVDLATTGGLNFALFTVFVSSGFLLVVVVALVFGDPVASEAGGGSLRYLLAAPVPRGRLLATKAVVAGLTSVLAMLTLTGTALLAGTLRYGWHPLRSTVAAE